MKLVESFFVDGRPVGKILVDSKSGAIDFLPHGEPERLPRRPWNDVDELKRQLRALYGVHGGGSGKGAHD